MSKIELRYYQNDLIDGIEGHWNAGARNVVAVSPTGSGKSATMARLLKRHNVYSTAIAHRQELVSQIALALAKDGVPHKFIAPDAVRRNCIRIQEMELGYNTHDPLAKIAVAGVDTLIRLDPSDQHLRRCEAWVIDEAHHLLAPHINKWGKATEMMPNACGLGVTATPLRADGKGLGRHADGVFDAMVVGPSMRTLINECYLTDYRIFSPPSDLDLTQVDVSQATGDYNQDQVRKAVHKSHIVGDAISHYQRICPGKRGIAFAVDVEDAQKIAAAFNAAGVPAAAVSAKTPDMERMVTLRRFRAGELKMLVNVDLFGEGFDVPACDVVIMLRPTMSYGLYIQIFGRCLRVVFADGFDLSTVAGRRMAMAAAGKTHGIIIDHVGNVLRHGLPDAPRDWTLDRRERRSRSAPNDVIPTRACPDCTAVYERTFSACPYCGYKPEPAGRSLPEQVDGDLIEMDPAALAQLRGEIERVDGQCYTPQNVERHVAGAIRSRHHERQQAQQQLRAAMNLWAGYWRDVHSATDSQSYRRFYMTFGVDVATAQTLGAKEAYDLMMKVIVRVK